LASVEKYAPESEVILVDDASRFRETLNVIEQFGTRRGWKVVRHDKAVGHSEACRAGAKLATRPYLCLLNSDTVVTPWCWRQLKELFENDRNVGIAGPSTSNSGNPQALPSVGNLSAYWNDGQIWAFAERLLTDFQEPVAMDLPWISGFALFIRRSLWEEMDGFNRDLQDYGNEVELCRRAAAKGFRLVWVRNSYIHHFGRQSYVDSIGEEGILARIEAAEKRLGSTNRSLDPSS
jgi:GT2 family glycosyltransferase